MGSIAIVDDGLRPWMKTVTTTVTMTHFQPLLPEGVLLQPLAVETPVSSW